MQANKKNHRKLRERIKINDLTDFEQWLLSVIPLVVLTILFLVIYQVLT
jgi:hypothetical protein